MINSISTRFGRKLGAARGSKRKKADVGEKKTRQKKKGAKRQEQLPDNLGVQRAQHARKSFLPVKFSFTYTFCLSPF